MFNVNYMFEGSRRFKAVVISIHIGMLTGKVWI